jgi:hypothetical protein
VSSQRRHSSRSTKSGGVGVVLQNSPRSVPGTASSAPSTTRKRPGSSRPGWFLIVDMRQASVLAPSNRRAKPGSGAGAGRLARRSARRRARAVPVSMGFGDPTVGNRAGPATWVLDEKWNRAPASVTEAVGSSPIRRVPASWWVVPRPSRRWGKGSTAAAACPPATGCQPPGVRTA